MANKTVTVKPSGGTYTSLNAALVGEAADLVTNQCILTIECYAMEDNNKINMSGMSYTTNSSYYINITVPTSERHNGKWNTSKYRISNPDGWGWLFGIYANFTRIDGIQIENVSDGIIIVVTNATNCRVSNSILKTGLIGINGQGTAYNCIISDCATSGIGINWAEAYIYNCTFVNCAIGVSRVGNFPFDLINNLFSGCDDDLVGTDEVEGAEEGTYSFTYNATDLSTITTGIPTSAGFNNRFSQTFTFAGASDFHLASTDAGARGYGVADPADGLFSDDIDGQTRGATWDIGADQYVASSSVALSGTATSSITESDIVAGGKTVILTLTGDTWIA